MKKLYFSLLMSFVLSMPAIAEEKAKVMIMGTFHFANPGADVVKTEQIDVMSSENQQYLEEFTTKVSNEFAPTHVLIECDPKEQKKYDKKLQAFMNGEREQGINENYQLGFRIAKKSSARYVCYDETTVHWNAENIMKWLADENGKEKAAFDEFVQKITKDIANMHKTLTLRENLVASNQTDRDIQNKSFYIRLNHIGSGEKFEGADAAASWWHRNFRMYANIQQHAQPGTRVFVIGGQGHTAILKDLLAMVPNRIAEDVMPLLEE